MGLSFDEVLTNIFDKDKRSFLTGFDGWSNKLKSFWINQGVKSALKEVAYDELNDMHKISSMQKKFRDSFADVTLAKWDTTLGTGGSVNVTAGTLVLASGTTINSETYVLSKEMFTIPFKASIGLTLSQRIANQTFYVQLVSVDPETGLPNGLHCAGMLFDGTTATQAKYRVQNSGIAPLDSTAVTIPTTASGGLYELEAFADEAWFHGRNLDNTNARANSYVRHQQIPDPNAIYKIKIGVLNGASAPASSTSMTVQFLAVQDYAELTAEITSGRGSTVAGQGLAVTLAGGTATANVAGTTAHDAVGTAVNPVKVGARAITANYTGVATGDLTDLIATVVGALVIRPHAIPQQCFRYSASLAVTTSTTVKAAGAAGIKNYVTNIQITNSAATANTVSILDGSTVIWQGDLEAGIGKQINATFDCPIDGTAATALNVQLGAATATKINVQGYQAP